MNLFSISELQQYSGIKAHTIRVWEQRYGALKPHRSEGNTRSYDGLQLRRLLNIVSLKNDDLKISELCAMKDEKLNSLLEERLANTNSTNNATEALISQFIAASLEFDEAKFDKLFSNAVLRFGIKKTYTRIIYPTLLRLGILWTTDAIRPAQEHFITNLIKLKLCTAIDALPPSIHSEKTWLLFLTEDEMHEIGLLFAHFLLRQAGHQVIYLGANVPFTSIMNAVNKLNPKNLLYFLVRKNDTENDLNNINMMRNKFKSQNIYLASDPTRLSSLKSTKKITRLFSVDDLEQIIKKVV